MILRVGIENNNDGRSIAWALEHPGCFAYGRAAAEAQAQMEPAARDYAALIGRHGMSWFDPQDLQVSVEETFDAYYIPRPADPGGKKYLVESFFEYDLSPLTGEDIRRALQLLDWSRQDLLACVKDLSAEQLDRTYAGERWGINGILRHVAGAEWWYQERIGFPSPEQEDDLPSDPFAGLELVRANFIALIPELEDIDQVVEEEGERWSPRKVLRRALWHERDHTAHIRKLL